LKKAFKARRNTLDTREPRTENQSVWGSNLYNQRVPALIRAFTKSVNQDLNIPIRYKEDPSSKDVQIKLQISLHGARIKGAFF
jgi:hypothetical protein